MGGITKKKLAGAGNVHCVYGNDGSTDVQRSQSSPAFTL